MPNYKGDVKPVTLTANGVFFAGRTRLRGIMAQPTTPGSTGVASINTVISGAKGINALTGTLVVAAGLTANSTVVANVGSTAGTGNVSGIFTYTFNDGTGKPGEES